MTRVLRLIARLNVGGPARHVVWLNEALAKNDEFDVLLATGIVPPGEDDMSDFAIARGVTPVVIPSMSRELSPRDLITVWHVWRLMVRFRPDIVHTHTAKAGAVGRTAGLLYRLVSRRRCRFVHTYHGHIFHSYYGTLKTRLFLAIERALARVNTDRIVVLSDQQLHEIRDTFRVARAEQFVVVPLGIDLSIFDDIEPRAEGEPVVGIVGRLTAIKNHDLFLRVAARLKERARFVIFGDGAERARLQVPSPRQRGEGQGEGPNDVVFAGTRNARDVYASLDIVALTSRNEGTPLALIEAMACGKPIVSTAVGGVVDLLGDVIERAPNYDVRERGLTVATDDTDGFVAALSRLLNDATLRARLSVSGKEYAHRMHSRERLVADIIKLYCQIA